MLLEAGIITYLMYLHFKTHWSSNCWFSNCMLDIDTPQQQPPPESQSPPPPPPPPHRPPTPTFINRKSIL